MSHPTDHFPRHIKGITESNSGDWWLNTLVAKSIGEIAMASEGWETADCLLHDIGQVIQRGTDMLARLAEVLAGGEHIETYTNLRIKQMNDTDFSDFGPVEYITSKHNILKDIAASLKQVNIEVETMWERSPAPIFRQGVSHTPSATRFNARPIVPDEPRLSGASYTRPLLPMTSAPTYVQGGPSAASNIESPRELDDLTPEIETEMRNQMRLLSTRGVGPWTCPLKSQCTKGGAMGDFQRNSDYKDHLQKHLKDFRCDRPGCTKRYPRQEHLTRHQLHCRQ